MMLLDRQDNFDIDEAQSRLDVLSGELSNSFSCNVWEFDSYGKWFIKLDFGDLEFLAERNTDWPLGQKVDWVLLTKVVWLSMISATTHHGLYVARLHGLKLFWAAMSRFRIAQVSKENGAEVLRFLLTHSWGNGTERKNLSLKSYSRFSEHFRLEALKASLLDMGLEWISRDLTDSFVKRQLKALIPKLTADELTFRDWREGGSFNLLTLDYGRYFVEHCFEFFEQHYPLASALATTFQSLPEIADSVGYKLPTVSQPSSFFLRGFSSEELKLRWPDFSIKTLRIVEEKICQTFKSAYKDARFEGRILKDENLEVLLQTLGVRSSHENVDRMRVILWNWISRVDRGETESLLLECQSPISMARFEDELTKLRERFDQEPVEMPSDRYYRRIGLSIASTSDSLSYPRSLIYLTLKAGFTSFIALTGWRQSEYGFALKAIKRTINEDKLDQYAFPWRYQVDWVVPKHHGEILQLREVTFGAVFLAERIKTLIGANDDQPCLYAVNAGKRDAHSSEGSVRRAVRALWGNFVFHYKGFKEVDDWNSWHRIQSSLDSGESLTNRERSELQRLLAKRDESEWSRLSIDINLKEARQRALAEWPRLEIFFAANRAARKDWLFRYREGTLQPKWAEILDERLSSETKDWIYSLPSAELTGLGVGRAVTNQLVEETLYPSPHAFRHMWAEAVYRRFDGDAGWMIRSQFKHISQKNWLSYVRNKDNRFGHELVKDGVISSLVRNYLRHQGKGYAGHLHTWLRRLFNKTSLMSPEEQLLYAEKLASEEIENIKANPWGYCLLKRRTRNKAKCAELGEPMRHNASPDLCLGCMHNLMQTGNVEWTLMHAAAHVAALKNPVVPDIFKASSYQLVKKVSQHVRMLDPRHEALVELEEVLSLYRGARV